MEMVGTDKRLRPDHSLHPGKANVVADAQVET